MAVRHRLAAIVLTLGLLAGIGGWRLLGPWVGLGMLMVGMVLAAAVYRVDKVGAARGTDAVSTPRPAAAPPSRSARGS